MDEIERRAEDRRRRHEVWLKVSILPKMIIHIAFNDQKLFFNTDKNMGNQLHRPLCKVEKILKGSLDSIPSPSVKIQIMGGKVCLRCKGNTNI